ncbi:hypothetical protein FHEFKHOI_01189 [Candidatus Methanoperedenaceae archaeon GB50]|nr:MAG: hypothetical protein KBONHNOK_00378 [Candidatus Methanoperedenaceae archaeon GB50]CAD7772239.1 hypothetical protein FHEFKHOI_01189 [Candidatus Methanoperedenaceae archaeon GB50]
MLRVREIVEELRVFERKDRFFISVFISVQEISSAWSFGDLVWIVAIVIKRLFHAISCILVVPWLRSFLSGV